MGCREPTTPGRAEFLARRLLGRKFTPQEAAIVTKVQGDLHLTYGWKPAEAKKLLNVGESKPDAKLDAAQLAAWTMVVNQLLNLDEVLCK